MYFFSCSPTVVNEFNNIPANAGEFVPRGNSNTVDYYCSITDDLQGVKLDENIVEKIKEVQFIVNMFGQSQTRYNTSFRLIAHRADATEKEYKAKYLTNDDRIIILLSGNLGAGNTRRNSTAHGEPLYVEYKSNLTNLFFNINGWILRVQLITDNVQDYISDASRVTITFIDKVA